MPIGSRQAHEVDVPDIEIRTLRLGRVTLPEFHPAAPGEDVIQAFLVRAGDECVLVDTGVGEGSALIDGLYQPDLVPLREALAAVGATPNEITSVVNTHLHFDHCGGNRLFPGVPIFVQRAELGATKQDHYTVREWVDFPDARYVPVHGRHALSAELELIPTPGHTPGHHSLVVRSTEGVSLVVGQAAYSVAEFRLFDEVGASDPAFAPHLRSNASWSEEAYVASLETLMALAPRRAWLSHDESVWERAAERRSHSRSANDRSHT